MTKEETTEAFYRNRTGELKKLLQIVQQRRKRIAWLRLFVALLTFLVLYKTWNLVSIGILLFEAVAGLAVFLYIVSKDANSKEEAENLQWLIHINEEEIKIGKGDYRHRYSGMEYLPSEHTYAADLDLLGDASLYQYLNRCTSQQGKGLLANRLLHPSLKEKVEAEQEAAGDLKTKIEFIQQMQAFGLANPVTNSTEKKIGTWLKMQSVFSARKWYWLSMAFPFLTLAFIGLYLYSLIPSSLFLGLMFLCYLTAFGISAKISHTYETLSQLTPEIETLQKQLNLIEEQNFNSKKSKLLQQYLISSSGKSTSAELKYLYGILNRFDIRLNHFAFFFLNTLFLWDLHQLLALNRWKERNQPNITNWFVVIAEMEYSDTLAILSFNHPDWCKPIITDRFFHFQASAVGHPLIQKEARVDNSFHLEGKGKVAVITGSNMGGKSTFLRSLGINAVLALMGANASAESLSLSVMNLMSSMRVSDNLSESASTFYAELKKLKTIIEATNAHQEVFILLDEILRGTNSLDRHTGSVALLKQLIQKEAVAVIATHDVELAKLKETYTEAIENYHFDVQAEGNELYFDYKLKEGICQSLNASILMKNIGIEME